MGLIPFRSDERYRFREIPRDARFPLYAGAGSDAVHSGSEYAFATTLLSSNGGPCSTGIVLTLGQGNQLVCGAIELLGKGLPGRTSKNSWRTSAPLRSAWHSTRSCVGHEETGWSMKRYGSLIGLRPEALDEYGRYHAAVRPEVLAMIRKCNIRNFSIFLKNGLRFSYFQYHGTNYDAEMAQMPISCPAR